MMRFCLAALLCHNNATRRIMRRQICTDGRREVWPEVVSFGRVAKSEEIQTCSPVVSERQPCDPCGRQGKAGSEVCCKAERDQGRS